MFVKHKVHTIQLHVITLKVIDISHSLFKTGNILSDWGKLSHISKMEMFLNPHIKITSLINQGIKHVKHAVLEFVPASRIYIHISTEFYIRTHCFPDPLWLSCVRWWTPSSTFPSLRSSVPQASTTSPAKPRGSSTHF